MLSCWKFGASAPSDTLPETRAILHILHRKSPACCTTSPIHDHVAYRRWLQPREHCVCGRSLKGKHRPCRVISLTDPSVGPEYSECFSLVLDTHGTGPRPVAPQPTGVASRRAPPSLQPTRAGTGGPQSCVIHRRGARWDDQSRRTQGHKPRVSLHGQRAHGAFRRVCFDGMHAVLNDFHVLRHGP